MKPFVPVLMPDFVLDQWRMSPTFQIRPDPNQKIEDNDMNSWMAVKPGQLQEMNNGRYVIYQTTFKPYDEQQLKGGDVVFQNINGKAEVWMDGKMIGLKSDKKPGDLRVHFASGSGDRILNVLIEMDPGKKAGLGGRVNVQPY